MFSGVKASGIEPLWPELRPHLVRACAKSSGRWEPEDFKTALLARDMQLWVYRPAKAIQAIGITEIVNYPRLRAFRFVAVTGFGYRDWQKCRPTVEAWAKAQGCTMGESIARKGWVRIMTDWKPTAVFIEKELR